LQFIKIQATIIIPDWIFHFLHCQSFTQKLQTVVLRNADCTFESLMRNTIILLLVENEKPQLLAIACEIQFSKSIFHRG
jgi:hypothetical protein